jgi:hypothetical protein
MKPNVYIRAAEMVDSGKQYLVKQYYIGRWCIWSTVLAEEEIPDWVLIQLGALGYTTWESKFADYIK